eukprot:COSAG06_NODE_90_length_24779_cov_33.515843_10_plen_127_part_00
MRLSTARSVRKRTTNMSFFARCDFILKTEHLPRQIQDTHIDRKSCIEKGRPLCRELHNDWHEEDVPEDKMFCVLYCTIICCFGIWTAAVTVANQQTDSSSSSSSSSEQLLFFECFPYVCPEPVLAK